MTVRLVAISTDSSGKRAMRTATDWAGVLDDALPKFGTAATALIVFFAVLLLIFLAAGYASGKLARPLTILVLLGPAALLLLIGLVIPAIRTVVLSFYDANSIKFVGGDNYKYAFTDPDIRRVLINTALWIIITPIAATALGLLLALLIDKMKHESVAKSLIFLPMAISFVGASIIWKFVYTWRENTPGTSQIGLLSQIVIWLGWKNPPNWILWQPWNTFLLMVIMIWVQTGFAMVVLSAAIKNVPGDVLEAASLDGATGFSLFRRITLPMVRGTVIVVLTTIMIAVLKIFDIVATMTGGNYSTSVLANEMYNQTFVQGDAGHGAALAVVLFVCVVPLVIYNVVQLRKERSIR
jgi:alpha-glucoside transport system permease protein